MDEKKKFEELRREVEELRREWGKMRDILSWVKEAHQEAAEWPKDGDLYWYLDNCGDVENLEYSTENINDGKRRRIGNVFKTLEDAEEARELLKWLATDPVRWRHIKVWKQMMEMADGGPYDIYPGLRSTTDDKCHPGVGIMPNEHLCSATVPSFSTAEKADECIRTVGEVPIMRDYFGLDYFGSEKWN